MSPFLGFLAEPRDALFKENDTARAHSLLAALMHQRKLSGLEKIAATELACLIERSRGNYQLALDQYHKIEDWYQAGYCAMLLGNLAQAQQYWTRLIQKRQNHWCLTLFGLVTRQLNCIPTTFQLRNHLESDIANLLHANRPEYLENLLTYTDFLGQINLEVFKFLGRSLMYAGWLKRAEPFMMKGQKTLPNDPEIYYHLGQLYHKQNRLEESALMLQQCLMITPSYTPARDLLNTLSKKPA